MPTESIVAPEPLDLFTLECVKAEVERRAEHYRRTWLRFPEGAGLVQRQVMMALLTWLDAQIADASAERWYVTELGAAALLDTEAGQ